MSAARSRKWPASSATGTTAVAVSEEGGVRFLHIGGDAIQSAMRLARPDRLELHYNRAMMAFLLFHPAPRRMLMIGLGGGSMARFLHRSYSRCHVTAVELNPEVLAAARRYFDLPADGQRFSAVLEDGAAWVDAHPGSADVLLLDAFDDGRQVQALCSPDFYASAFEVLGEEGILAQNFMSDDDRVDVYAERIAKAFGREVLLLQAADRVNTIVFAFKGGRRRIAWSLLRERAKSLAEQFDLPGDHYLAALRRTLGNVGKADPRAAYFSY